MTPLYFILIAEMQRGKRRRNWVYPRRPPHVGLVSIPLANANSPTRLILADLGSIDHLLRDHLV